MKSTNYKCFLTISKKTILLFSFVLTLFSCSKDDSSTTQENYRLSKVSYQNGNYKKYTYNSQGKLAKEEWFNSNQISTDNITYSYNSQGKVTGIVVSYNSGATTKNIQKTYNSNGFIDEEIETGVYNGTPYSAKTTYITNSSGYLIEKKTVHKDNTGNWLPLSPYNHFYYTNDSQGRAVKAEPASLSSYYEFTYDSNGNMLTSKDVRKSGTTYYLETLRTYTYDDKINPEFISFGFGFKNNTLDEVKKDYLPDGSLTNTYSYTHILEYNTQGLPTKIDGNVYTYEKY